MPSYVIRKTITSLTKPKILGKLIRIFIKNNENFLCEIGPICSVYPMKYGNVNYVLIFYLNDIVMEWVLYNYKQIEIPKNSDQQIYNLIINSSISEGDVPVKIILDSKN